MSKGTKLNASIGLKSCDKCEYYLRCEECVGSHYREEIPKLNQQIADLKTELAEKDNTISNLSYKVSKEAQNALDNFKKMRELEQQLAEKEKEVERLKEKYEQLELQSDYYIGDLRDEIKEADQDKISFAVEKLVGVQKYIDDKAIYIEELEFGREIKDFIYQQIKQLTHQHEDKGE
jgi:predicted RNase H-like nuclease (RuvC/YqgF family)